jgi:ABC-type uncharacterized transport system substrate-binding protein
MDGVHVSCLKIVKVMVPALLGIGVFLFGAATSAQAQKKFSIGSLNTADQFIKSFEGFRARMAELGFRAFGFKVAQLKVASTEELEKLTAGIERKDFDAIFTPADSMVSNGIDALAKVATTERPPLISSLLVLVKRGARRVSLPIELPWKFKLAINLKTAKSIDLRIAKEWLLRADDVID